MPSVAAAGPREGEAREQLDEVTAFIERMGCRHYLLILRELWASLAYRLGDAPGHRGHLDEARRLALEIGAHARADAIAHEIARAG